jgi:pyruvate,water dikinase
LDIDKINLQYNSERLRDIDPNYQLSILKEKYEGLSQAAKSKIHEKISIFPKSFQRTTFEKLFTAFLIKFGHFSDSNSDFSRLQWKERPDLILKLIIDFKETGSSQFDRRKNKVLIKNPAKRIPLSLICSYSTKYVEYSKRVSYVRSLGFAFLKDCFIYLGRLFKAEGLLENEQDIFFMTFSEIRSACKSKDIHREYRDNLERRKKEIAEYKDLKLPEIIYGEIPPIPSTTEKGARVRLKWVGVTTSKGYYEGPVKIVKGVQDFDKIQFGDVLVVPYAHISWTPLFAKAKALISESGGMLSHLSIWARESHIPAVVSVQGALELEDNTRVAVDGNKGEVIVLK